MHSLAADVSFSGSFTSTTALKATVRAKTHGHLAIQNCDTGKVSFTAHRVSS